MVANGDILKFLNDRIIGNSHIDIDDSVLNLQKAKYIPVGFIEAMSIIFPVATEIFGRDRWSGTFGITVKKNIDWKKPKRMSDITFNLDIHFPNLTITNSKHESIDLTDMYFRLEFDSDGSIGLLGTRGSISLPEFENNYSHSHLQSNTKIGEYTNFCLGNGEIDDQRNALEIALTGLKDFLEKGHSGSYATLEDIHKDIRIRTTHLLLQIEPYLSWESIEGGPYISMKDIFNRNGSVRPLSRSDERIFFRRIKAGLIPYGVPIKFNNGRFVVSDNEELEQALINAEKATRAAQGNTEWYVRKDKSGSYFSYSTESTIDRLPKAYVLFNGEYRPVTMSKVPDLIKNNYYIHPQLKKYVIKQIEYFITIQSAEKNILNGFKDKSIST